MTTVLWLCATLLLIGLVVLLWKPPLGFAILIVAAFALVVTISVGEIGRAFRGRPCRTILTPRGHDAG